MQAEGQRLVQTATDQLNRVSEIVRTMLAADFKTKTERGAQLTNLFEHVRVEESLGGHSGPKNRASS